MTPYLWICLGSALGGAGRYWVSGMIARRIGESFPAGTLIVNVSGCFAIGLLATLSDPSGRVLLGPAARQFLLLGFLGGYTTFSSFSLQTLTLMQDGEWLYAMGNVLFSVFFCLAAVWLGHLTGGLFNVRH